MTATPTAPAPAAAPASESPGIEASCRGPLLNLFLSAVCWLVIASGLSLFASIKLHAPTLFAGLAWTSYGRLRPAALDAFLYGFAVQAGFGAAIWIICRLGQTRLVAPLTLFLGHAFWSIAVFLGVAGVLAGGGSGYPALEMPSWIAPLLFAAYVLMAIPAVLTFHARRPGPLYPSQWFILGAIFWFAWIFSTAALVLLYGAPRGVLQASASWWFANNFSQVFLGFAGLASVLYFIPKLTGRALYSSHWAAFAFWMLALFGSWSGLSEGSPLPVWMSSMSVIGTIFTIVPVIAITMALVYTLRGQPEHADEDPSLRFCYVAASFWVIASVQLIVGALPKVNSLVGLTWFGYAQRELQYYGFFAFSMFAAIYYIVPRLLNSWWCPRLLKAQFWLAILGVLTLYISLLLGGVAQGVLLSAADNSFLEVLRTTMTAVRISTIGDLLIFASAVVFLANFGKVFFESGQRVRAQIMERIS